MASVNLEMEISSEAWKKHTLAADFLNLNLQISSDLRVAEEEGYSPMATLQMPPFMMGLFSPGMIVLWDQKMRKMKQKIVIQTS